MGTRKYDFTTGIETSTAPSASDPSAPDDPVILSYIEEHYVPGYQTQATITALKNLPTADRTEGDIVFVKDQNVAFRYSASATDTNDDYFYLTPVSSVGRWIRITDMQHATGNLTVPGALTVQGDLTVNGTTTTISTSTLTVEDANITVNLGGSAATANANVAGITVDTDTTDARLGYDSTLTSKFKAGNVGSESEVLVAAGAQTITGTKTITATPSISPAVNLVEQGSAPATPAASNRAVYATSTGLAHVNSSGTVANVINDVGTQTISGVKTFQNAQVFTGNPDFQGTPQISIGERFIEQGSAPATPASGSRTLYASASGFKQVDSTGLVSDIGGSGGGSGSGEINVITSSSTASGWVASGAGLTVGTSTTGSELPLEGVITSGIKITPVSGTTDFVYYRFTMPEGLFNTKLKLAWYQEALSGYASGDLKVELHTNTLSDYTGTDATIPLSTDVSGVSGIPNAKGQFNASFDSNSSLYYELRFYRTAGSTAVVLQNVIVGPGTTQQSAIFGPPVTFTPTGSWTTNTTYTGKYYRIGNSALIHVTVAVTGAPTATSLTINMPTGLTIDTTALSNTGVNNTGDTLLTSDGRLFDSGTGEYNAKAVYNTSSQIRVRYYNATAAPTNVSNTAPMTWATGDYAQVSFLVPIAEWAGSGAVNLGQNDVEYAYNSSTADTSDTTSFAYGPVGSTFNYTFTANRSKRVRFQSPIQDTDIVTMEVQEAGTGMWLDYPNGNQLLMAFSIVSYTGSNGVYFTKVSGSSTDVDVFFGQYRTGTQAWSTNMSTYRWRLKKTKAGVATGFGEATTASTGLVKKDKVQTKNLASSNSSAGVNMITFNNLLVGQLYKVEAHFNISSTGASHSAVVAFYDGSVELKRFSAAGVTSGITMNISGEHTFIAPTSTLHLRAITSTSNTYNNTSGGFPTSWATITQLNTNSLVTDFT